MVEAAGEIIGLHGTDPIGVYLQAWARVPGFAAADLDAALYDDRLLVKLIGMRRTLFVLPIDIAAIVRSGCGEAIARGERPRLLRMLREAGIASEPEEWLGAVEDATVAALDRLGEATATELTKEVPGLREQIPFGPGKKWEGTMGVSTRLLFLLSTEGRIVRGRPKGGITSSLYRWTAVDRWIPGGLAEIPPEEARAELVRRYLGAFGPALFDDVRWWTGWTVADTRRSLAAVGAVEVDVEDGGVAFVLADDVEDTGEGVTTGGRGAAPSVALLPALDATIMGWTDRRFFLGDHKAALFDRAGNAGPSVWLDGRVVGGWGARADGEIVWRPLEDIGDEAFGLVEDKVAALHAWLGGLRFSPRFRTPLELALVG